MNANNTNVSIINDKYYHLETLITWLPYVGERGFLRSRRRAQARLLVVGHECSWSGARTGLRRMTSVLERKEMERRRRRPKEDGLCAREKRDGERKKTGE